MSSYVIVKPKPGSLKFQAIDGMTAMHSYSTDEGATKMEMPERYNKERFPKSRQMFRPMWSFTKKKWLLKDFDTNSPALDELVKSCRLKYREGDKRAGQMIESADIYDYADPFFTNKRLRVIAGEGETRLDKNHPLDKVILAGMLMDPKFKYVTEGSHDLKNTPSGTKVKYLIVDRDYETKSKTASGAKERKVSTLFDSLNDKKRMTIAMSLGLIVKEDTDREIIDNALWAYAKDQTKEKDSPLSKQDVFITYCDMDTKDLNTRFLIGRAKSKGLMKKTKQGWLVMGHTAGKTDSEVERFFSNDDNQELIARLEEQLDQK
jgi:hypothetical protein